MSTAPEREFSWVGVVLCDFDGTITPSDTTDGILDACAYDEWREIEEKWKSGEITTQECMEEQTLCIREGQLGGLDEYLSSIEIDPYFREFAQFCSDHAVRLVVESDGYCYAIKSVLRKYDLDSLPVRSNRLVRLEDASCRLEFPHQSKGCAAIMGACKCKIARRECATKWGPPLPLIVIGNDRTDQCVANRADHVFARKCGDPVKEELVTFCSRKALAYDGFTDFKAVRNKMPELMKSFPSRPAGYGT
jgi:2-hydroxy-3-keto-5-methylthiopentenyl-1-phosphate phosphatase